MKKRKKAEFDTSNAEQRKTLGVLHWVYQREIAKFAKELFNYLDENLRPRFFIVGIPQDDLHVVWLEPSEDSGYEPEFFDAVMPLAKEIENEEYAKNARKNALGQNNEIRISSGS